MTFAPHQNEFLAVAPTRILPWGVDGKQPGHFRGITPYLFVAPALIVLAFTCLYPVIKGFELSFFDWKLGTPLESRKFVGWENFIWAWNDPALFNSIKVTVIFAISAVSVELCLG